MFRVTVNRDIDDVLDLIPIKTYQDMSHTEDCNLYEIVMEKMKNLRETL